MLVSWACRHTRERGWRCSSWARRSSRPPLSCSRSFSGCSGRMAPSQRLPACWPSWSPGTWRWSAPTGKTDLPRRTPPQCTPSKTSPLRTRAGATDWTDGLPGPLGAVARNAPATLAAPLIVGVAVGINGLLAEFTTSDRDDSVYVLMRSGAIAEIKGEGDSSRSLRVTLLTILEKPERTNPSLTAKPYRKYWAAEVMVENTGAEDISAPAWKLRACGKKHDPVSTPCSRRGPGERLHPSPGAKREPDGSSSKSTSSRSQSGCRARLPDHPAVHFASRALCLERR